MDCFFTQAPTHTHTHIQRFIRTLWYECFECRTSRASEHEASSIGYSGRGESNARTNTLASTFVNEQNVALRSTLCVCNSMQIIYNSMDRANESEKERDAVCDSAYIRCLAFDTKRKMCVRM